MIEPEVTVQPDAPLAAAQALIDAHRVTGAVALLNEHITLYPDDRDADYLLGLAAYGAKDDELALEAFRRCVRANPNDAQAQFGLEMTLSQQQAATRGRSAPQVRRRLVLLTVGPMLLGGVAVAALLLHGLRSTQQWRTTRARGFGRDQGRRLA